MATIFDPLILREAKLQALLHCFDTTPFSKCGPPTDIIDALVSLGNTDIMDHLAEFHCCL